MWGCGISQAGAGKHNQMSILEGSPGQLIGKVDLIERGWRQRDHLGYCKSPSKGRGSLNKGSDSTCVGPCMIFSGGRRGRERLP